MSGLPWHRSPEPSPEQAPTSAERTSARPGRRALLTGAAATAAALALAPAAGARAAEQHAPRTRKARTLRVDPSGGAGVDATTVQGAIDAASSGDTITLAPGTYREIVTVPSSKTNLTLASQSGQATDTVIVYNNSAGTTKPGGGTYGTSGSATVTVQADGFTARGITFANDWLRKDHPGWSGTQAVAILVKGDRAAFLNCRFLGHQDTLYADSASLSTFARQYFKNCYVEGDVDFVFGRGTAVYDGCHFHTLVRTDLSGAPFGFVFAPSTAVANPHGYLVINSTITSAAPAGYYKLARPWVPSSDTTARPMLTVRETDMDQGIDAKTPYANMSDSYPWQNQRFAEYHNTGAGAQISVPANRPQLTDSQASQYTKAVYLGSWTPPSG